MSFEARYAGFCEACGERIVPGQHVEYDTEGSLCHSACDLAQPIARPIGNQCQIHHLTMSLTGVCDACEEEA